MPAPKPYSFLGGIDLGGTKIETALFTDTLAPVTSRRRLTPKSSYPDLIAALSEELLWLSTTAPGPLRIGLGMPGVIDPQTGRILTANLPATGQPLAADLQAATGHSLTIANDAMCFALSEAHDGAGAGHARVFGLILGTGVAGGLVFNGAPQTGATGLAGEVGHSSLPACLLEDLDLPLLRCGCGRRACYESLISGPGLTALHHHRTGQTLAPQTIAAMPDAETTHSMARWHKIVAELLWTIQTTLDPDCIILGGGLSNIPQVSPTLHAALKAAAFPDIRLPVIACALHGDASGTRGAALLASRPRDRAFAKP